MDILGKHYILELCDADYHKLNDKKFILESLRQAIIMSGATLLEEISVEFTPQGITAVCLLSESHMSIHTWTEKHYATVDVFTCGDHTDPGKACDHLVQQFECQFPNLHVIDRGIPSINTNKKYSLA